MDITQQNVEQVMSQDICNDYFCTSFNDNILEVGIRGNWTITNIAAIEKTLATFLEAKEGCIIRFQCNGLKNIDTSGAWVLYKKYQSFLNRGHKSEFKGFQDKHFRIVKTIIEAPKEHCPDVKFGVNPLDMLVRLGELTFNGCYHMTQAATFLGRLYVSLFRVLIHPKRMRFASVIRHIQETGLNAIPIVAMIAFLFSVVLSYQGAVQLRQFGAEVFTVNLTAVSVLREIGVLMTAILVAGRSGSAFAAEIGVMKIREEVDALETMGADIFEVLVVPRVLGLVIALPLLVVIADLVGLVGGGLMSYALIDMPPNLYMDRVLGAVKVNDYLVGMIKAPVFAFLIATVGTFRGLQVSGSADSIGRFTTLAVVQSISLIVLADAIFTIVFTKVGM